MADAYRTAERYLQWWNTPRAVKNFVHSMARTPISKRSDWAAHCWPS